MLHLDELTDDDLLNRAKAGDARSFGVLYARHVADGVRYARRLVGTAAEDVVAEAITKVLEAISRGYGPRDSFRPYLFTAIRSVAQDLGPQRARTVPVADLADADLGPVMEDAVDLLLETSMLPVLVDALGDLTPAQREVLWYLDGQQHQPSEIAERLGISPNAVSARAYRARRSLRRRFLARHLRERRRPAVCAEVQAQLEGYLRGSLSAASARSFEEHLDGCRACSGWSHGLLLGDAAIDHAPEASEVSEPLAFDRQVAGEVA